MIAHTGARCQDIGHWLYQCKGVHNTNHFLEHKPAEKINVFMNITLERYVCHVLYLISYAIYHPTFLLVFPIF
jgi:hypothetical protein